MKQIRVNTSTSQRKQAGSRRRKRLAQEGHLPPLKCDESQLGGPHGWVEPINQTWTSRKTRERFGIHACPKCEETIKQEVDETLVEIVEMKARLKNG